METSGATCMLKVSVQHKHHHSLGTLQEDADMLEQPC